MDHLNKFKPPDLILPTMEVHGIKVTWISLGRINDQFAFPIPNGSIMGKDPLVQLR
ncbi:hypothetical protein Scep_011941 [Stephania cephalantha]|uniref:Uncharacterized protein n=1 Tax=Stephania cephalantha TaxID=152367 RepID=A0AAP0P6B3_9MAGN